MRNILGLCGLAFGTAVLLFIPANQLQASKIPVVPGGSAILHLDSQTGLSTTVVGPDTFVDGWADQSAFGNAMSSTLTQRPKVSPGSGVGLAVPVVDFDGVNDRLLNSGNSGVMSTVGSNSTYSNITVFMVAAVSAQPNNWRAFLSGKPTVAANDYNTGFTLDLGNYADTAPFNTNFNSVNYEGVQTAGPKDLILGADFYAFDTSHVMSLDADAAYASATLYIDGVTKGSATNLTNTTITMEQLRLGGRFFGGIEQGYSNTSFAKVVIFEGNLNTAERVVVENNLAAATGATLTTGDRYAGDTTGNGDYDLDVIGIGRVDATNALSDTTSISGLRVQDNGASLGDAEFLMAGHKVNSNSLVSFGGGNRWSRVWYLDKSDGAAIDATLSFDFSDAGLAAPAPTDLIQLLYSPTDPFSFSALSLTAGVSGDTFTFNVPNGQLLDGYYTLSIQSVPEPGSAAILAIGSLAMFSFRRRVRTNANAA